MTVTTVIQEMEETQETQETKETQGTKETPDMPDMNAPIQTIQTAQTAQTAQTSITNTNTDININTAPTTARTAFSNSTIIHKPNPQSSLSNLKRSTNNQDTTDEAMITGSLDAATEFLPVVVLKTKATETKATDTKIETKIEIETKNRGQDDNGQDAQNPAALVTASISDAGNSSSEDMMQDMMEKEMEMDASAVDIEMTERLGDGKEREEMDKGDIKETDAVDREMQKALPLKRGPGRPKKVRKVGKVRRSVDEEASCGLDRKLEKDAKDQEIKDAQQIPLKKPRGRPRKVIVDLENGEKKAKMDQEQILENRLRKRKRGCDDQEPQEMQQIPPKRSRGLPREVTVDLEKKEEDVESSCLDQTKDIGTNSKESRDREIQETQKIPPKRGRGRPKKVVINVENGETEEVDSPQVDQVQTLETQLRIRKRRREPDSALKHKNALQTLEIMEPAEPEGSPNRVRRNTRRLEGISKVSSRNPSQEKDTTTPELSINNGSSSFESESEDESSSDGAVDMTGPDFWRLLYPPRPMVPLEIKLATSNGFLTRRTRQAESELKDAKKKIADFEDSRLHYLSLIRAAERERDLLRVVVDEFMGVQRKKEVPSTVKDMLMDRFEQLNKEDVIIMLYEARMTTKDVSMDLEKIKRDLEKARTELEENRLLESLGNEFLVD
ncbi:hypothetical protein BZA77DRAFT_294219 [Pyronema omphalodes]|nr:hypothetical protein BZA77DRAFT_294219 [Pyronema omphalodes]